MEFMYLTIGRKPDEKTITRGISVSVDNFIG